MQAPNDVLAHGTDFAAGWEIGRAQGQERVGGRLFDRLAPKHLHPERAAMWRRGYAEGLHARRSAAAGKNTKHCVSYADPHGATVTAWMGGTLRSVINTLAYQGVTGDVHVITPAGVSHRCGI